MLGSIGDGENTFTLTDFSPVGAGIIESSDSVTFNYDLFGSFNINDQEYDGRGTFTANYTLGDLDDLKGDIADSPVTINYSSDIIAYETTDIPEPTALLGLLFASLSGLTLKLRKHAS